MLAIPKDVLVRIRANSSELERAGLRSQAALRKIGSNAVQAGRSLLGISAAAGVIGYTVKRVLLDPFVEQEDAVVSLGTALAATGKTGTDALRSIADEASRLQGLTKFGDEGLIAGVSTLATLAPKLRVPELVTAQQALVGIATVFTKGDVDSAAQLLGKTLGSTTNALARYGIQVDPAASASEKLAQIVGSQTLGAAFEVAQAQANTLGGQLTQLSNALGDTREVFGEVVARALGLDQAAGGLVERVTNLNAAVAANMDRWVAWTRVAISATTAIGSTVGNVIRVVFNIGQVIGRLIDLVFEGLRLAAIETFNLIARGANRLIEGVNALPGVEIDFRFSEVGTEDSIAYIERQAESLKGDVDQIVESTSALAGRWRDVADAVAVAQNTAAGNTRVFDFDVPAISPAGEGGAGGSGFGAPGAGLLNLVNPDLLIPDRLDRLQKLWLRLRIPIASVNEELQGIGRSMDYLVDAGVQFADLFSNAIASAASEGISAFARFRDQILAMLTQIAARFAVFQLLSTIPGLGTVATAFGQASGFLEARGTGGPVTRGSSYLVGESGPELFVPNTSGTITSNSGLRASLDLSGLPPARDPLSMARDGQWLRALYTSLVELKGEGVSL